MPEIMIRTLIIFSLICLSSCSTQHKTNSDKVKLITLDPGHFHAALVQKTMYNEIDSIVHVYGPPGEDITDHLKRIEGYNSRNESPTHWNEIVYQGPAYLQKMLEEKAGNIVILAGNNQRKTEYIKASLLAGLHVLADKPMSINMKDFEMLKESFEISKKQGLLLYDIMTERSEITTILQRELSMDKDLFGELEKGDLQHPAVTKESVHHFSKMVSGTALKRPVWFFDVMQQGEGIVDVTTHLVDLIQWECFPDQVIDTTDIAIEYARRWPTLISRSDFNEVTSLDTFPAYLDPNVKDSILQVYSNGEINYTINGIAAKVSVIWNFKAPEGSGDTHYSVMRGTKANLVIRQGKDQQYKPSLYVEPVTKSESKEFEDNLRTAVWRVGVRYPGIEIKKTDTGWELIIPEKYRIGHEAHFAQVMERFLKYLKEGKLPDWEIPNMIAKYYTTAKALEIAKQQQF